ncbi:MAG: autotransporter-associated beta strand repeat-containing protein [Planctomycetes bacterium]|nr:autotransporter-associated beta strand repeat-containing protein [Planctomycetota bacterium]
MQSNVVTMGTRLAGMAVGSGRLPAGVNCTFSVLALVAWLVGIPASAAINTFTTGTNFSTGANWSAGSAPTGSGNAGSFTDSLYTSSSGTSFGTTTNTIFLQSYNVTNGSTYRLLSSSAGLTQYRAGNTTGNAEGVNFTNGVSGSTNDLVYLSGNSGLTFSGTTLAGFETRLNVRVSGNFRIGTGSVLTVEGPISTSNSAYTITKVGGGKVVMGGSNTYTGTTTISEGTWEYAANNVMADGAPLAVNGGLWDLRAFSDTVGTVTLTSGTIAGSGGLTIKNDSQFSGGVVSANLTGTSGFTLPTTAGSVVMSGINTYSGTTKISGGTLQVTSTAALSPSSTLNSGGSTSDTSTLDFRSPSLDYRMNNLGVGGILRFTSSSGSASRITFQAASGNGFSGAAANKFIEADANTTVLFSGTFDLATVALTSSRNGKFQGAGNVIFNGPVVGTGTSGVLTAGLTVQQSATVALNAAGTYTGPTDVTGGRLIAGNVAAFGSSAITVSGSGTLDLNSLAIANSITNNGGTILNAGNFAGTQTLLASATYSSLSAASTLNVGNAGKATLNGSIAGTLATLTGGTADLASGGSLTQSSVANAGKFIFSGTADTSLSTAFSGAGSFQKNAASILSLSGSSFFGAGTQITAGGLLVTGSIGGGLVDVSSAASIGGTGRIGGDLNLQAGAKFNFVQGNTLAVTGSATFGGFSVADILGLSSSTPDGTYTLISGVVDLANVSNVGAGNAYSLGGDKSAYLQQGSLQLVVVPEPSTLSIAAGGAVAALLLRRRRTAGTISKV